jgi:hypothetical protein
VSNQRGRLERGVYAQGWFARGYNYHPSLPPRRLKMAEDFAEYRATMITWPSLGGGPISLAYLEDEAFAPLPARYRQYGFLKDSEFMDECRKRGVKGFSVIFSTQGWECPAELNEAEDEIRAMNELRGVGKRTWLGLREFTQNTYPKIWAPFEKYFPNGLTNSRGQKVTDLFEECVSRDIHGNPHHAEWLEVPVREHICHFMDINNPVWREYLKAIVRIHVDAGVDGIQFDEPDSPLGAMNYGGSFSYDNVEGFRQYLLTVDAARVPDSVDDLETFHYGSWLLERGVERVNLKADGDEGTLARLYVRFLQGRQAANFAELAAYVREYAASKGRTVLVSSNLYNGATWHDPLAHEVDILVPEQLHTLYEQPAWMRYIAGFGGDKPVCISTNPYGGVLPELLPRLNRGRDIDRFRVMHYEAAAMGVNMSVQYGAWMGSVIEDAVWAPHEETVEMQNFLADNEELFARRTHNSTLIVYSIDSNFIENVWQVQGGGELKPKYPDVGETGSQAVPFEKAASAIAQSLRPFDVAIFHDGVHRADDASAATLGRYERVILPGCSSLTSLQISAIEQYLDGGGHVTVVGELGGPDGGPTVERIRAHDNTIVVDSWSADELVPGTPQVRLDGFARGAVNIQAPNDEVAAVHIVNYDYDVANEHTRVAENVTLTVALPFAASAARVHAPGEESVDVEVTTGDSGEARLTVPRIGVYAIVELLP